MKKTVIIATFLLLAAIIVIVLVLTNINTVVKAAIERYGSQATKTAVRVASVEIELAAGRGSLAGLAVANPAGFSLPDIVRLRQISLRIPSKPLSGGVLLLDEVRVSGPEVFSEMNSAGSTNIEVFKKNLERPQQASKPGNRSAKETRIVIRKFVFEHGKIDVRMPGLSDITVVLPRLELNDIGGKKGVAPAEAARVVATALAEQAARTVLQAQGERVLRKGAEGLLRRYREQ
jgi:uncharacterized protein involved in outer membrane biogenesis